MKTDGRRQYVTHWHTNRQTDTHSLQFDGKRAAQQWPAQFRIRVVVSVVFWDLSELKCKSWIIKFIASDIYF